MSSPGRGKKAAPAPLPATISLAELRPGDALLIGGHPAICVSNDLSDEEEWQPIICHISSNPHKGGASTNTLDDLRAFLEKQGNPGLTVFRPPADAAEEIAKTANLAIASGKTLGAQMRRFFSNLRSESKAIAAPSRTTPSISTTDTQFVIECVQIGMQKSGHIADNLSISARSSAGSMTKALRDNSSFTQFRYLGAGFKKLISDIEAQLKSLEANDPDTIGLNVTRSSEAQIAYMLAHATLGKLEAQTPVNDFEKCLCVLKAVLPPLQLAMPGDLTFSEKSPYYKAILKSARQLGISEDDINHYSPRSVPALEREIKREAREAKREAKYPDPPSPENKYPDSPEDKYPESPPGKLLEDDDLSQPAPMPEYERPAPPLLKGTFGILCHAIYEQIKRMGPDREGLSITRRSESELALAFAISNLASIEAKTPLKDHEKCLYVLKAVTLHLKKAEADDLTFYSTSPYYREIMKSAFQLEKITEEDVKHYAPRSLPADERADSPGRKRDS